jgi:hypothetical protein
MIAAAEARWSETAPSGRMTIGIDPSGSNQDGDESAFVVRVGKKVMNIFARRGLTEDGHVAEALGLVAMYKGQASGERPLVVVDRDGYVGARVYAALAGYQQTHDDAFQLVGVRGGERAHRKPLTFDRVRDEVWFALVDAFRDGLAIPEDVKLERELAAIKAEANTSGRSKVTGKDDLRRELGRSPDRADALCLAAFQIGDWHFRVDTAPPPVQHNPYLESRARGIDPYAAMDVWSR